MSDQQPDLNAFLAQAQALQEQLTQARAEAAEQVVIGEAAGGDVKIEVTGALEFRKVYIAPSLGDDVELLEDLVLAALRDVVAKVDELNQKAVGGMFG